MNLKAFATMSSRFRNLTMMAAFLAAFTFLPSLCAEDAVQTELTALRQLLEKQGKQIDLLTEEVVRLRQHLGVPTTSSSATYTTTPASPAVPLSSTSTASEFEVPAQPSSPAPITTLDVHIVVKGESLDSIAKLHKTTISELQRLNKITDPKKLQIGQSLQLPSPPDKKEN